MGQKAVFSRLAFVCQSLPRLQRLPTPPQTDRHPLLKGQITEIPRPLIPCTRILGPPIPDSHLVVDDSFDFIVLLHVRHAGYQAPPPAPTKVYHLARGH